MFRITLRSLLIAATATPPVLAGMYFLFSALEPIGFVVLLVGVSFLVVTWLPVLILCFSAPRRRH
jgi:hypothetical protein